MHRVAYKSSQYFHTKGVSTSLFILPTLSLVTTILRTASCCLQLLRSLAIMEIDNEEETTLYSTNLYAADKTEYSDSEEGSLLVTDQYSRQPTTNVFSVV